MKSARNLILILFIPLILSGCIKADAVKFHSVKSTSFTLSGMPKVNIVAQVENTSRKNITIEDVKFHLHNTKGDEIAVIFIREGIVIPKKALTDVSIPLTIELPNIFMIKPLLEKLKKGSPDIFVSGGATTKAGCMKKKLKINNMPLPELMRTLEQFLNNTNPDEPQGTQLTTL